MDIILQTCYNVFRAQWDIVAVQCLICVWLCDLLYCSMPGFPILHYLLKFGQTYVHWVCDAIQPSHPLLPASPPALSLSRHQVFFSESGLCIRWPKYWSFSLSISPSNEYSGLIYFRIDWFNQWDIACPFLDSIKNLSAYSTLNIIPDCTCVYPHSMRQIPSSFLSATTAKHLKYLVQVPELISDSRNESESESCSVMSDSLWPRGLCSPWNSLGQSTGVGSLSLLQGIFPTQGSNQGLLHCRWILYQVSHKGSPRILEWVAYPFFSGSSWPRNWTRVSCIAGRFFTNWALREATAGVLALKCHFALSHL